MVVISEKAVRRIIEDVAPKIERLTGWDAKLDTLEIKIINRDQYWEKGVTPKYVKLGVDTKAETEEGKKSVQSLKKYMPYLVLGQYEVLTESILIMPDNLRFGTNESGLSITLGHELVHRCQFINNSKFARMYSNLVKRAIGTNAFDEDGFEEGGAIKYLQAYMTLAEGDASFIEEQLQKMFYQDAKNKTLRLSNFLGLILSLTSIDDKKNGLIEKFMQYEKGKKKVKVVYEKWGRRGVNALYELNEAGLEDVFR